MKTIGILAGKGGVGKSVVTASIALSLQKKGFKVGIIDADIYGPSIKQLLSTTTYPVTNIEGKIEPACSSKGIFYISLAFFQKENSTTAVRAPIANDIIIQFLTAINWSSLDYLLIDFPPGTGDIPLTLIQQTSLSVVVVTTPGVLSRVDVEKAIVMCLQCNVSILGVIENMSYITANDTKHFIFGESSGEILSNKFEIPFLGEIPLCIQIGNYLDRGDSIESVTEESFICSISGIAEQIHRKYQGKETRSRGLQPPYITIIDSCLEITWRDGLYQKIPLVQLQQHCLCQECRNRGTLCPKQVGAKQVISVGNYAIRIVFTSGCCKGIYPFHLIREIGGKSCV